MSMSEPRIRLTDLSDAYKAVLALEEHVRSRIDDDLLELVKLRASIINGCTFCLDMHSTDALKNGEDVRRVIGVAAWRESPFYSDAERAALALTDAVTRISDDGVPDPVWDAAVDAFGCETAAELVVAIATINVWNRLAITARATPPPL